MKFAELEEKYIENLLLEQFGNGRVIQDLRKNHLIQFSAKFSEIAYSGAEGEGCFAIELKSFDNSTPPSSLKSKYGISLGHIVLSIHGFIEEKEKSRFLGLGRKINRKLILKIVIKRDFFTYSMGLDRDMLAEDIFKLKKVVKEYRPYIASQSGMHVDRIIFSYEK